MILTMNDVINLAELDQQTFGDPDLKQEVLQLFAAQAPTLMAALAAASGTLRAETAHRIRGSALAIGATRLAAAADVLEQRPDAPDGLALVERAMADVINAIQTSLSPNRG
jgi:HPt (histidine-containing phosphotransfer) domain-containing protein